jgi:hypothetical protein
MFADSDGFFAGALIFYLVFAVIVGYVAYVIIRTAVLRALNSHYKTVRLFEKTGEWEPGYQGMRKPRDLDKL